MFSLTTPQSTKRCPRFVIHPSLSSTAPKHTISCWLEPKERFPNNNRRKYLETIRQMKNTDIEKAYKLNYAVSIDSNCPLLYLWLSNGETTQSFINHNLLPPSYKNSPPSAKMRVLVQEAMHRFFIIDPEVEQLKQSYKQQLLNYYLQHSSSKGVTLQSFNQYIGLHIRMGVPYSDFRDEYTYLRAEDLKVAVNYINQLNSSYPIYLATDSFYAKQYFSSIYHDRLIYYSSPVNYTTDRWVMNNPSAHISNVDFMQKLVMTELLLLAESSFLVGTDLSTYSTMASFMGNATTVFIKKYSLSVCSNCYAISDY